VKRCCATCAKLLPAHYGPGRPRKHCDTDHCAAVFNSAHHRRRCTRCGSKLARGRAAQRAAICGTCFIDLIDLASLTHAQRKP